MTVRKTHKPLKIQEKNPVTIEITGFLLLAEWEGFEPSQKNAKSIENTTFFNFY
jgi:hypothetical protein